MFTNFFLSLVYKKLMLSQKKMMGLFVVILFTFKKRHQSVRKVPTHGDLSVMGWDLPDRYNCKL